MNPIDKRRAAIRKLRGVTALESALEEIGRARKLSGLERKDLLVAGMEKRILQEQLSFHGGHSFLPGNEIEFATKSGEPPKPVEVIKVK